MPRPLTNTQFISKLLEFGCPTGALIQPFVIQAIESYSKQVISAGPDHFESALLAGEAWVQTAEFALKSIEERK